MRLSVQSAKFVLALDSDGSLWQFTAKNDDFRFHSGYQGWVALPPIKARTCSIDPDGNILVRERSTKRVRSLRPMA